MAKQKLREADAKRLISTFISRRGIHAPFQSILIDPRTDLDTIPLHHPWVLQQQLVIKPDQLFGKRKQYNLVFLPATFDMVKAWLQEHRNKQCTIGKATDRLTHFIMEPYTKHTQEYYVSITSQRDADRLHFSPRGGMNIEERWNTISELSIAVPETLSADKAEAFLAAGCNSMDAALHLQIARFLAALHDAYVHLNFSSLEINPFTLNSNGEIVMLDMVAELDGCAEFKNSGQWENIEFPRPFGRMYLPEEEYIRALDKDSGASLKLTVLNPSGRVWNILSGGGASVILLDSLVNSGLRQEIANYGEYSGNPTTEESYQYGRTILQLMTSAPSSKTFTSRPLNLSGKVLFIAGAIANFTDIEATFKGIVHALEEYAASLREQHVTLFVRRGGPNDQKGLAIIQSAAERIGIPAHIVGSETPMTALVPLIAAQLQASTKLYLPAPTIIPTTNNIYGERMNSTHLFTKNTTAFFYNLKADPIQRMLDFDYLCQRTPSITGIIHPGRRGLHKAFFGAREILIPIYSTIADAAHAHPATDVLINFASFRSAFDSSREALQIPSLKTTVIVAEGVPERQSRELISIAKQHAKTIIGPSTVGGITAGAFRIANAGGTVDNILRCKLYRPGSVGLVSKSGGILNEMFNLISRATDGIYEGIAIGGDAFPGSTLFDHMLRYEANPGIKLIIGLGELGGKDEYDVVAAKQAGKLTKPIVMLVPGSGASIFPWEVQFGHAGAKAGKEQESADAKNAALRAAGIIVPVSFEEMESTIHQQFQQLVAEGKINVKPEPDVPSLPENYAAALKAGTIRKPTSFTTTISSDIGEEPTYGTIPISKIIEEKYSLGDILGLLWFKKQLPPYFSKFLEKAIILCADHGPAVSGAHNAIVASRAGKDVISSLCSGLLTIGPRFGGAIDDASRYFKKSCDQNISPGEFVEDMKRKGILIPGIGHRVKSRRNPDKRVELLKEFARNQFPPTRYLDYALSVEKVTTQKAENLILNVDGCIGVLFLDALTSSHLFTEEEMDEMLEIGYMNGLFALARSIGVIGHILDQKRLKEPLYRHPTEDIFYRVS